MVLFNGFPVSFFIRKKSPLFPSKQKGGKDFSLPHVATYCDLLQPIATYMKPLRCCRLLLHSLKNLLADVEADLHGERDHESVADLRPARLIRCLLLHLRGELHCVLLNDWHASLDEVCEELLLRLLYDVERALLHCVERAVSDFCPLAHNTSFLSIQSVCS